MHLNQKQKENLAQFYSNLALAVITFGVISPIFTGIGNYSIFSLQLTLSIIGMGILLQVALNFLK